MNEHQVKMLADAIKMVARAIVVAALIRVNRSWYESRALELLEEGK